MLNEFTVGFRTAEKDLDAMVPLSMSAEGVGAAMFLIAFLAGSRAGGVTGLLLVMIGAGALFAHLGHPRRSWRVITEAGRTWMSRGAVFTAGLVVCGAVSLLFQSDGVTSLILRALALVCTLVVVGYAGIMFSLINAVPFWNTSLLPVLFVLHSLTSAALLLTVMLSLAGSGIAGHPRECAAVVALLASTLALTRMLPASAAHSEAAQESVRLLTSGHLETLFHRGALTAGLEWPLALMLLAYLLRGSGLVSGLLLVAAVALRVTGDVSFRSALLRAGVYAPVV